METAQRTTQPNLESALRAVYSDKVVIGRAPWRVQEGIATSTLKILTNTIPPACVAELVRESDDSYCILPWGGEFEAGLELYKPLTRLDCALALALRTPQYLGGRDGAGAYFAWQKVIQEGMISLDPFRMVFDPIYDYGYGLLHCFKKEGERFGEQHEYVIRCWNISMQDELDEKVKLVTQRLEVYGR